MAPETWVLVGEVLFNGLDRETGIQVAIGGYEWSPIVQFNKLDFGIDQMDDMAHIDAELCARQELNNIEVSQSLNGYNKFKGRGLRKVGLSRGRSLEYIIFYPDGELTGMRLLVVLYGSPNTVSLKEMDEVIKTVSYSHS